MRKNKLILLLSAIFILVFGTLSCEVGLGSQVDTQVPVISILSPEMDSLVKDNLKIDGTWSDDGTIAKVNVSLSRTDNSSISYNYEGEIITKSEGKGIWTCNIPTKDKIKDGPYVIEVDVIDQGGHTTKVTRQMKIDNTPPVVALERPFSAAGEPAFDKYGQAFTLVGEAADDSGISKIEITFFDDKDLTPENKVHTITKVNIDQSINVDFARFSASVPDNDYGKLYEVKTNPNFDSENDPRKDKLGNRKLYFSIKTYDNAGNFTEDYYLKANSEVSAILREYKITGIYKMASGNYVNVTNVSKTAEENKEPVDINSVYNTFITHANSKGQFILNKLNNPVFKVTGYEPLEDIKASDSNPGANFFDNFNTPKYQVTNGETSKITLELTPGLDNIPINREDISIGVYEIPIDFTYEKLQNLENKNFKLLQIDREKDISQTGLNYAITITPNKFKDQLVLGKNYVIRVIGQDTADNDNNKETKDGNEIYPIGGKGTDYGFRYVKVQIPVSIYMDPPKDSSGNVIRNIKYDDTICLSGSVSYAGAKADLALSLQLNDKEIANKDCFTNDTNPYKFEFKYKVPAKGDPNSLGDTSQEVIIKSKVVASEQMPQEVTKNIFYDVDAPEILINPVQDAYISGDNDIITDVNGKIKINGTASDTNGLASVQLQYKVKDAENWNDYGAAITDKPYNWSVEVDTTDTEKFKDNSYITFRAIATDITGNVSYSDENTTLHINQDSDRPIISFINLDVTPIKESSTIIEDGSASKPFGFELRNLTGRVIDDDGVKNVYVKYANNQDWKPLQLNNAGIWNIEFKEDGLQSIQFKVVDSNNKEFGTLNNPAIKFPGNDSLTTLNLKVDTKAPAVGQIYYQSMAKGNTIDSNKWVASLGLAGTALGGVINQNLYLKVEASDSNGIGNVILDVPQKALKNKLEGNKESKEYSFKYSSGEDGSLQIWQTDEPIDIEAFNTGTFPVTLKVLDKVGKESTTAFTLTIDNKAPVLSVTSHKPNDPISSNFLLKGITDDDSCTIKYQLTASKEQPSLDSWTTAKKYYIDGNENMQSWGIYFDKDQAIEQAAVSADLNMHDSDQKQYFLKLYGSSKEIEMSNDGAIVKKGTNDKFREILPFYFHFQTTDKLGNVSYNDDLYLKVDPQGDMPVVLMTYPTENNPTLSGIIRIMGIAKDDEQNVTNIYLQIDPHYNGKKFIPWDDNHKSVSNKTFKDIYGSEVITLDNNEQVINIGQGLSWSFSLNKQNELNGVDGNNNKVAIRLKAKDNKNNISSFTEPYVFTIDSAVPKLGSSVPFTINKYGWIKGSTVYYTSTDTPKAGDKLYTDSGCRIPATVTYDSSYEKSFTTVEFMEDMWLKGEWWLNGSVEDESGISELTFNSSLITNLQEQTWGKDGVNQTKGFVINQRIGSNEDDNFGKIDYNLVAYDKDASRKKSEKSFSINFDNKIPECSEISDISVFNQNGFYTIEASATEIGKKEGINTIDQSGFDKVVFYFESKNKENIYDSYLKKGTAGHSTPKTGLNFDKGLYWKTINGSVNGSSISLNSIDNNIHVGGLVKVQGAVYKIETVNGSTITVKAKLPEIKGTVSVQFAIGHVIDHLGTESLGKTLITEDKYYGYYSDMPDDDGDKMIEKVQTTGTSTIWKGSINSNNIPDGPVVLTYVVFDKAGNYLEKTVTGKVENNAPRLASLGVWNDFNKNKKKDQNEVDTFYFAQKSKKIDGKWVPRATDVTKELIVSGNGFGPEENSVGKKGSAFKTIKDEFIFVPEIVGGNGKLWYSYNITNGSKTKASTTVSPLNHYVEQGTGGVVSEALLGKDQGIDTTPTELKKTDGGYLIMDEEGSNYISGYTGDIIVDSTILTDLDNNKDSLNPTWFTYTISDSTGSASLDKFSETSLSSVFNVALNVQYKDSEKPTVSIKPFYWNSNTDNSISENNPENGHIELSGDLKEETFVGGNGYFDKDAKVSGRIKIEGTAADNIKLKDLYVTFPGINGGKRLLVASYDAAKGTWTSMNKDTSGKWTFTATDGEHKNDKGDPWHNVNWTLDVDTTIVGGATSPVGLDQLFEITAKDERGNNNSGLESVSDTKSKVRMDVVPYITEVVTYLSNKKRNNPSVYNRTALGHYPIKDGEEVTLKGFNLGGADVKITPKTSGSYTFKVSDGKGTKVAAINNKNNNEAKGSYSGEKSKLSAEVFYNNHYNRKPNGDNNNLLTDDVVFDVWEINSKAAISKPGVLTEPVMHINPADDSVGFAFTNGPAHFSMPGSGVSYKDWQFNYARYINVEFIYDAYGNAHGISTGIDTAPNSPMNTSHVGRLSYFNSQWGTSMINKDENYNGTNAIRLEGIGAPDKYIDEYRFNSPSLATTEHTVINSAGKKENQISCYFAYYDDIEKQIKFRYNKKVEPQKDAEIVFRTYEKETDTDRNKGYVMTYGDQFVDNNSHKEYTKNFSGGKFKDYTIGEETKAGREMFSPKKEDYSLITEGLNMGNGGAGKYVDIDAISGTSSENDIVVAVWYDGKDCWYGYNKTPDNDTAYDTESSWVKTRIFTDAGEYCTIKVGPNGGIHIAAYDPSNANLVYAHMNSYELASTLQKATVDALNITGTHISLDVIKNSEMEIPYISFYSPSIQEVRMAYPVNPDYANLKSGANELEEFTGDWEITTIPSPKTTRIRDDNTNIALWKNADGTLKAPEEIQNWNGKDNGKIANNAYQYKGYCYGNKTQNPILAYAVSDGGSNGAIETAQMK